MVLDEIPDLQPMTHDEMIAWAEQKLRVLKTLSVTPETIETFHPCRLESVDAHACGAEASALWRKFFLATLLADWACYPAVADRADYARLKYIMTSAYRYFCVWFCRMPDGTSLPVGYTGWYPIAKFVYEGLRDDPAQIDDRGIFMPLRHVAKDDIRYAYAFNISIIDQLKDTPCSRKMALSYRREAKKLGDVGIAAITFAPDGAKFSTLLDLKQVGKVTVQGEEETLFLRAE